MSNPGAITRLGKLPERTLMGWCNRVARSRPQSTLRSHRTYAFVPTTADAARRLGEQVHGVRAPVTAASRSASELIIIVP